MYIDNLGQRAKSSITARRLQLPLELPGFRLVGLLTVIMFGEFARQCRFRVIIRAV
jgi:hypothetical protein